MKEGWKYMKLVDVCDFQGGSQPPKAEWATEKKSGYIRMLQIRDYTQSRSVTPEYVKITNRTKLCLEDDIMIGRYGASLGKILTGLSGAYNVAIMKTIPSLEIISKPYLMYYLLSTVFQNFLLHIGGRAAQAGFSKSDLINLEIPVPPLPEQQEIVTYLDNAFAKIDAIKANAEKSLADAKALFQSALKEMMEPKEGWEEESLKNLSTKIGSGATPKGGRNVYIDNGCCFIRSMNVQYNEFKYKDLAHITENAASQLKGVEIQKNDVLFNITGASIARCCVVPEDVIPARVNQHVSIIRLKDIVNPRFLSFILNSPDHQKTLIKIGEAGSTRQALTKTDLENHLVSYPTIEEQICILSELDSLKSKVTQLQQNYTRTLAECDALKQALLKQVFE